MLRTLTTRMIKSRNVKDSISKFQIPGVGGVKEATHGRNSRYAKSRKYLDRRIIKIVDC
jgi:hypothetical protein